MPGPVHLKHLVRLTYVAPRARTSRLALVPVTTPVEFREADAADAPPVHVDGFGQPLRGHEGALWVSFERLGGLDGLLRQGELWSSGPEGVRDSGSLALSLIGRTPLVPQPPKALPIADHPPPGSRTVRDGTERGVADLRRYLDANVLLVDGMAHVRLRGPLFERASVAGMPVMLHSIAAWRGTAAGTNAAAPRLDACSRQMLRHLPPGYASILPGNRMPDDFPRTEDRLDDVSHFLQSFAETLHEDQSMARCRAADDMLRPWLELGAFGSVRLEEADDAFRDLLKACDLVESTHRLAGYMPARSLARLRDYVAEIAMPALDGRPAPADEAAMDGLSP